MSVAARIGEGLRILALDLAATVVGAVGKPIVLARHRLPAFALGRERMVSKWRRCATGPVRVGVQRDRNTTLQARWRAAMRRLGSVRPVDLVGSGSRRHGGSLFRVLRSCVVVTLAALLGCSSIYTFESRPRRGATEIDDAAARERLQKTLIAAGFHSIGSSSRATGDLGCGRDASDRHSFQRATTGFLSHKWVWVHEFSCDGVWHVVIISSRDADPQAAEVRERVAAEFAPEIAVGTLHVDTRHRFLFE